MTPFLASRKITPTRNVVIEPRICDTVDIRKELGQLEVSLRVLHGRLEVYLAMVGRQSFQPQACIVDVTIDEVDCVHWDIPFLIEEKPYPLWVGAVEGG